MTNMAGLVNVDVGSVLSGIGSLAKDLRVAFTGKDPALDMKLLEIEQAAQKAQVDVNLAEAQNPNLFVSGWRPAVGWVCAFALTWYFILAPLLTWTLSAFGVSSTIPAFDTSELMSLLMALLGVGAMRSYDKSQGTSK
jgi:hypothetical protein